MTGLLDSIRSALGVTKHRRDTDRMGRTIDRIERDTVEMRRVLDLLDTRQSILTRRAASAPASIPPDIQSRQRRPHGPKP